MGPTWVRRLLGLGGPTPTVPWTGDQPAMDPDLLTGRYAPYDARPQDAGPEAPPAAQS